MLINSPSVEGVCRSLIEAFVHFCFKPTLAALNNVNIRQDCTADTGSHLFAVPTLHSFAPLPPACLPFPVPPNPNTTYP